MIIPGFASTQIYISDLGSNEPLFQLLDYSLNIINPLTDNSEPFEAFEENF